MGVLRVFLSCNLSNFSAGNFGHWPAQDGNYVGRFWARKNNVQQAANIPDFAPPHNRLAGPIRTSQLLDRKEIMISQRYGKIGKVQDGSAM
jgi:hypothetical protein